MADTSSPASDITTQVKAALPASSLLGWVVFMASVLVVVAVARHIPYVKKFTHGG